MQELPTLQEVDHKPTSLTVLHLSDMQFGRNHRFGRLLSATENDASFDKLVERLRLDLDSLQKLSVPSPDIVVVSGDLAEWGKKEEFEDAHDLLSELGNHLGLSRKRFIIVPGNHDINRNTGVRLTD